MDRERDPGGTEQRLQVGAFRLPLLGDERPAFRFPKGGDDVDALQSGQGLRLVEYLAFLGGPGSVLTRVQTAEMCKS